MRLCDYVVIARDTLIGDPRAFKIENRLYVSPAVKYLIHNGTESDLKLLKEFLVIVENSPLPE